MADVFDRQKRSDVMRAIKSRNTQPEIALRRKLRDMGFRPATRPPKLPGTPDVVLSALRTVVFVHGCFWHRHAGCARTTTPATRVEFWDAKFARNVARDRRVTRQLRRLGWRVVTVWECRAAKVAELRRVERLLVAARERITSAAAVADLVAGGDADRAARSPRTRRRVSGIPSDET
jgi:DNA mismatch endonuclease, patch repair protein